MEPLHSSDPRAIGPFRVEGRIGAGGMGQVFLAADQQGRRVAIKVAHSELTGDARFRERFRREIRMASTIPAWFTAAVVGADPDAAPPWLATAYVEGPSLRDRVRDGGPLPTGEVIALGARLAAGLAIVHSTGLVHRDLKPANVILSAQGPRLIDFGIARGMDAGTLTGTGHLMGTPQFMSPEQASGSRDVGPYSDLFGLGALLVFAATGASPFEAETVAGSIYRIMNTTPDVSGLPEPLRSTVRACLARDPAVRPTADRVRAALEGRAAPPGMRPPMTAQMTAPVPSRPFVAVPPAEAPTDRTPLPTAAPPRRRRSLLIVAAVVLAVLALGGVYVATRGSSETGTGPSDLRSDSPAVNAAIDSRFGTNGAQFRTPSGNIACRMTQQEVRCDVADRSWTVPAKPAACRGAWATGAVVRGKGAGALSCVDGELAAGASAILNYGEAVQLGGQICVSRPTGVRCETADLHGFAISRTSYELF